MSHSHFFTLLSSSHRAIGKMVTRPRDDKDVAIIDKLTTQLEANFDENCKFDLFTTLRYNPVLYSEDSEIPLLEAIDQVPLPESLFFLFDYHYQKFLRAGAYFDYDLSDYSKEKLLLELTKALQDKDKLSSYRIRVVMNRNGSLSFVLGLLDPENHLVTIVPKADFDLQKAPVGKVEVSSNSLDQEPLMKHTLLASMLPISTNPITEPWIVYMAPSAVVPSPFTSFKTTRRELHNYYRNLFGLPIPGQPRNESVIHEFTNTQDVLLYTDSNQVLETTIASIAVHRLIIHPTNGTREWGWVTPPLLTGCLDGGVRRWLLDQNLIKEDSVELKSLKDGEIVMIMNAVVGIRLGQLKFSTWKVPV